MQTTVIAAEAAKATKAAELGFAWLRGRAHRPAVGTWYTSSATAPPDGGPPAGLVGSTAGAAPSYTAVVAMGEYLVDLGDTDCQPLEEADQPDPKTRVWQCSTTPLQVLSVHGQLRSFTPAGKANVLFKCDLTQNQHISYRQDSWAKPFIGHDVRGWECQQWRKPPQ